MTTTFLEHDT